MEICIEVKSCLNVPYNFNVSYINSLQNQQFYDEVPARLFIDCLKIIYNDKYKYK